MGRRNEKVFALLEEQKKKYKDIADTLGISKSAVTYWKKNGTDPTYEQCQKLAPLFGVSVEYLWNDEETKETMVIDPGGEADKIVEMLDILEANVKYIYLTHCHGDHIGAVSEVKSKKGGKILIHRDDAEGLDDENINLSACINMGDIELEPDSRVDDRDLIHVGSLEFRVIHTPGHTKGSTSLYCEKEGLLFSGDTLFRGTFPIWYLLNGKLKFP